MESRWNILFFSIHGTWFCYWCYWHWWRTHLGKFVDLWQNAELKSCSTTTYFQDFLSFYPISLVLSLPLFFFCLPTHVLHQAVEFMKDLNSSIEQSILEYQKHALIIVFEMLSFLQGWMQIGWAKNNKIKIAHISEEHYQLLSIRKVNLESAELIDVHSDFVFI